MTYNQKFEIALSLESAGITSSDLNNLQCAIYTNDQDLVNSEFAWMHEDLEKIGITPANLKSVLRWIGEFLSLPQNV